MKHSEYANRLAHLYLLRELNGLEAYLLLVCFVNDEEMNGPTTELEWEGAIQLIESCLGVRRHKLAGGVLHLYIDVHELGAAEAGLVAKEGQAG